MHALPPIEVRNPKLDFDGVPRYWHGGRRSVTTLFNGLSLFFPPGERFFIASVKAHADRLRDPALREQARAFYSQEGYHSREHQRYNEMLERQGYPAKALEGAIAELLARVRQRAPLRRQLAITCALEHWTALLAELLLDTPEALEGADPTMAELWRWHAAEETEHKAVAFDVYEAVGGTRAERAVTMTIASLYFSLLIARHQIVLMRVDGTLWSGQEWLELARFLAQARSSARPLLRRYLAYFRKGFHPWQHDNRALLERWKRSAPMAGESSPAYGA